MLPQPSNDERPSGKASTAGSIAFFLFIVAFAILAYALSLRPWVYTSQDSAALRWFGELLIWAPDYLRVFLVVCLLALFVMVVAIIRMVTARLRFIRRKANAAVRSGLAWAKRR